MATRTFVRAGYGNAYVKYINEVIKKQRTRDLDARASGGTRRKKTGKRTSKSSGRNHIPRRNAVLIMAHDITSAKTRRRKHWKKQASSPRRSASRTSELGIGFEKPARSTESNVQPNIEVSDEN